MSLGIHIVVLSLVLAAVQAPAMAASSVPDSTVAPDILKSCYDEARWPIHAQPAYVTGGERVREQRRNGFNRDVFFMNALCDDMAKPDSDKAALASHCGDRIADMLKAYGRKVRPHAERTRDICQAMTGQPVSMDGI